MVKVADGVRMGARGGGEGARTGVGITGFTILGKPTCSLRVEL